MRFSRCMNPIRGGSGTSIGGMSANICTSAASSLRGRSARPVAATAALKRQRFGSGAFGPIACGSYFTAYWIQQGRLADQQKWVSEQLAGEMATRFDDKSVQTATTYDRVGSWQRDSDGVPPYLALAHHYPGLVWLVLQRADNRDIADLANWLFDDYADRYWTKSVVASAVAFSPRPKEPWWPPAAPEVDGVGERLMVACFLEEDPSRSWDRLFAPLQEAITSVGEALFAAHSYRPWSAPTVTATRCIHDPGALRPAVAQRCGVDTVSRPPLRCRGGADRRRGSAQLHRVGRRCPSGHRRRDRGRIRPGDRVAVWAPNSARWLTGALGAQGAARCWCRSTPGSAPPRPRRCCEPAVRGCCSPSTASWASTTNQP